MGGGGGKSNDSNNAASDAVNNQTALAERLIDQTDPLRQQLVNQSGDFLGGQGMDAMFSSPRFQAMKASGDAQYQQAQNSIISNTPEGGGLTSALANLDATRALGETQAAGGIAESEINRALQLATGGAAMGTQGLGQAGSTAAQMALAESQSNAGKASGLGSAGGAIGASWIDSKA